MPDMQMVIEGPWQFCNWDYHCTNGNSFLLTLFILSLYWQESMKKEATKKPSSDGCFSFPSVVDSQVTGGDVEARSWFIVYRGQAGLLWGDCLEADFRGWDSKKSEEEWRELKRVRTQNWGWRQRSGIWNQFLVILLLPCEEWNREGRFLASQLQSDDVDRNDINHFNQREQQLQEGKRWGRELQNPPGKGGSLKHSSGQKEIALECLSDQIKKRVRQQYVQHTWEIWRRKIYYGKMRPECLTEGCVLKIRHWHACKWFHF